MVFGRAGGLDGGLRVRIRRGYTWLMPRNSMDSPILDKSVDRPVPDKPAEIPTGRMSSPTSTTPSPGDTSAIPAAVALQAAIADLYPASLASHDLSAWIPDHHTALGVDCDRYRDRLAQRMHQALVAPVRHLVDAGGQNWRPLLIAEAAEVMGHDSARIAPLLAAFELTHVGSLIVDDIQDDSPLRRGRPAAHIVYGLPSALNAGTAAYFVMDRAIRGCVPGQPSLQARLTAIHLRALHAGHVGQALDLQGHADEMDRGLADGDSAGILEAVRTVHRLKSGEPVARAFEMIATLYGADPSLTEALTAFGSAVGTAYQITDDTGDLTGVHRRGSAVKRAREDLTQGKVTMPLAHASRLLPPEQARALWESVRTPPVPAPAVAAAARLILDCGAADACRTEADQLLDQAWQKLFPLLPADRAERLIDRARKIVHRERLA